ncbi:MAG: tetratricopeptide repeat protein, partial [Muribaculaceae bacterium]|nr:tetratricopeptide repeat protein [Muribaculaceae bacterium]
RFLLQYAMADTKDPTRNDTLASISDGIMTVVDQCTRRARLDDNSPDLYYSTLRYERLQPDTIASLIDRYTSLTSSDVFGDILGNSNKKVDTTETEALERRIFNRIWTTFPLSRADMAAIADALRSPLLPADFKVPVISAIMLGALEFFETSRVTLLLDFYRDATEKSLRPVALTAAVVAMMHRPTRSVSPTILNLTRSLAEAPDSTFDADLRIVITELARTRDTERINKKMRDEVMPTIMSMRPKFQQRFTASDPAELADPEQSPKWMEMLDKSGLTDTFREISEMQQEGADVMMSTFIHLKSFPFFNDVANWFLPFSPSHSAVAAAVEPSSPFARMIAASPMLCDSDKYSMAFSMSMMPQMQRDMIASQLEAQKADIDAIAADIINRDETDTKEIVNRYVRNLYRFFKLYRRKGEFNDPFASMPSALDIPAVSPWIRSELTIGALAEFHFTHQMWSEALRLFNELDTIVPPDATLYQKMGFCYQNLGDLDHAIDCYLRAELLDQSSLWTLRRIASCSRATGSWQQALDYYRRIDREDPDKPATTLAIGECLTELGRYAEAVKILYKAAYLKPDSMATLRRLAWALLLNGDLENSRRQYQKVIQAAPTPADYINMGHIYLIEHNYQDAANAYKLAMTLGDMTRRQLVETVETDLPYLTKAGADARIVPLLLDNILYDID